MPTVYMLIGVPGSGKSTWVAGQPWDWDRTVIASTDGYIERQAREQGTSYNALFKSLIKPATAHMDKTVKDAVKHGHDIIWDQTNTSAVSRKKKLDQLPGYKKVAVVFPTPDDAEHTRRLGNRPGKSIPDAVMAQMKQHFEMPTEDEGFAEIWFA